MTLIEVLAGLALLAALLGGLLLVKGRSGRQWSQANRRLEAVAAADALLSEWWRAPRDLPRSDEGALPDHDGMFWRTRVVHDPRADALRAQVVRLQIVSDLQNADRTELARVEVVLQPPDSPPDPLESRRGRPGVTR